MPPIYDPRPENLCPVCGEKPTQTCRCMISHSECANGHKWHSDSRIERKLIDGRMHTVRITPILVLDN